MPNGFVVRKYVEDKEHKVREYETASDAVLAERGLLLDYPDAIFVAQEIDGAGNEVPNREVNPRVTLKTLEAEVRPKFADIMGAAKAIVGATGTDRSNDDPYEADLGRIQTLAESILGITERLNQHFK